MYFVLSLFLFFLLRVFFINPAGVFFDSAEYLGIFKSPNYIQAVASGHFPPHVGYNLLFWPIFNLGQFIHFDGATLVIVVQIVLSFFTVYCFYHVIRFISDKKTGLYASIIASVLPLFWIINVTVMMENAYAAFFFISLFLLVLYLRSQKRELFIHVSLLLFVLGVLTQTFVVLWAPVYVFIVYLKRKDQVFKIICLLIGYTIVFSILNVLFISVVLGMKPMTTFHELYLAKGSEFAYLPFSSKGFLIWLRNFIIPLYSNNTIFICLLSFISLIMLLRKNKKFLLFGLLWIAPAAYTNQWWDALLNGRHALLTSFGLAFLVAYLLRSKPYIFYFTLGYLLLVSVPALYLLRLPIPYLQEAQYVKTLPPKSLLLESHFARPQVQSTVRDTIIYVNEPGWTEGNALQKVINGYLVKNEPVFVSSAALSEPYGLYSGPYLHNLSLSYTNPFILEPVLTHDTLTIYKTLNAHENLYIYKIVSNKKSPYPAVHYMTDSNRRIDYYDPLSFIERFVEVKYRSDGI